MSIKTKLSTSFDSTKQTAFLTLNWTGNNDPGAWDYAALYGHKPRGTDDDCLTNQWVHTKARSSYVTGTPADGRKDYWAAYITEDKWFNKTLSANYHYVNRPRDATMTCGYKPTEAVKTLQHTYAIMILADGSHVKCCCYLNYAQIHFASVAAFVAGWRSS